jgi:predicted DNA binding protein
MMTKYALITWKDGYKEVASLDEETTGILRYYVIERVEKSGRLSFESATNYPELKVVSRKPDQIESIVLTENSGEKVFILDLKENKSEGGRTDHHYEIKAGGDRVMDALIDQVKQAAKDLGIDAKSAKETDLEKIRKAVRLSCFENQSEVLGFIKGLLERAN